MKKLLICFLPLLFSFGGFTQSEGNRDNLINDLTAQKWCCNVILGDAGYAALLQKNEIVLSPIEENPFGYFVVFNLDGSYESYNQGFCGNECRTHVYGNYEVSEKGNLTIVVKKIEYLKMCSDQPVKMVNATFGNFQIERNKLALQLHRID
ncbi:MAG: hypothetical protein WC044_05705 [Crocinitomicaceae bacterium]